MSSRAPYSGPSRKLVVAFDVGTTFSGISYCILDPGSVPEIRGVTKFPAQEHVGGDSKVPTIVMYDKHGNFEAAGAEALDPRFKEDGDEDNEDEDGKWVKAEWFKLHLRPKTKSSAHITQEIPPLPKGKSAIDLFADFLQYLFKCARIYFEQTHSNGVNLWRSLVPTAEFVLTHPNGWEGAQQTMMRNAAITAGLIPNSDEGRSRIFFVTEGEASLHFCIQSGSTSESMKKGKGIIIVDAGGGTIDISTYKQTSTSPPSFEETAPAECHMQGAVFVTRKAGRFLETILKTSRFLGDVPHIAECFDKSAKLTFRNVDDNQFIKFGTLRDKDLSLNIRSGQLKLSGHDVASFFEPSVQCIIKSIADQLKASQGEISSIFLVGGFSASEWVFAQINDQFVPKGLDVTRPDSFVNKAVPDGAISFHIDHYVNARVAKFAYGTDISARFNPRNPEHVARSSSKYLCVSGEWAIDGLFDTILPKGTKITETQEFIQRYSQKESTETDLNTIKTPIFCYRGTMDLKTRDVESREYFMDKDPDMYSVLCSISADLSRVPKNPVYSSSKGVCYYRAKFSVVLSFGLTELKACICWKEGGVEKRSPAEVVYDPDVVRED